MTFPENLWPPMCEFFRIRARFSPDKVWNLAAMAVCLSSCEEPKEESGARHSVSSCVWLSHPR